MDSEPKTDTADNTPAAEFDAFEIRVLAVLVEKEALTPDAYPMTLNALTNGCNQLSSRDPVMSVSEETVNGILQTLIERRYVSLVSQAGARVPKYEHRLRIKWSLERDRLAILALLMLRGPQTAGEIRSRSGRLHEFASVTDVETGLQYLIDKYPPLVARLAKAPGTKEVRYAHLLAGEASLALMENSVSITPAHQSRVDRVTELQQEVARLRGLVEDLSLQFDSFKRQFD